MAHKEVLIIGGGAAGLTAAIAAARQGARVTIIERNSELGRKLLVTGNGRCNFSNLNLDPRYYHSYDLVTVSQVLKRFDLHMTLDFFASLGLHYSSEDGRLYPRAQQGSVVRTLLLREIERLAVRVLCSSEVRSMNSVVGAEGIGWQVELIHEGQKLCLIADAVVIAIGGQAGPAPQYYGEGVAVGWLQSLQLPIIPTRPALVPLRIDVSHPKRLIGARCPDCMLRLYSKGQLLATARGEMHWSREGVSGIPVLDLSGDASAALARREEVILELDLLPELSPDDLRDRLQLLSALNHEERRTRLSGLIHEHLARRILELILQKEAHRCDVVAEVVCYLKGWRLNVLGTLGFAQAQVTAGGVALGVIDPTTMEVRDRPGLYLVGEILDVDATCGGYNLQWAWSSGYIAGASASGLYKG